MSTLVVEREEVVAMAAVARALAWCGVAEEETVTGAERKAPGACPRCGGAVVATDVETARRILCLPLCVRNKRKFSCSRCRRALVALYAQS